MAAFLKADANNLTDLRSSDSSHLEPIHYSWFVGTRPEPFELDALTGTVRKSLHNPGPSLLTVFWRPSCQLVFGSLHRHGPQAMVRMVRS